MKSIFASFLCVLFFSQSALAARAVIPSRRVISPLSGCVDCFNFVAPTILGSENVSPAEVGLLTYDSYYNGFRGFNASGVWQKLSNDKYIRTVSSATTLVIQDEVVWANAASAAFTITLPAAASIPGREILIKKTDSSVNAVTVDPNSSETIDGAATKVISFQNEIVRIVSDGTSWKDITSQKAIKAPTVSTVGTSFHTGGFSADGSGTYTTPAGVLYIKVRMVGGGGGGAGSGTSAGSGSGGGNTTFGSSLLSANGGGGATAGGGQHGGTGGSASLGSGPVGSAISGGTGTGATGTSTNTTGGHGGSSAFGGSGGGGPTNSSGQAGKASSGSGGGGGGTHHATAISSGSGGGAGGFVDAIISSPSASYSYATGSGGSAGSAGSSGNAGGAGGSGYIEVTEYYQ